MYGCVINCSNGNSDSNNSDDVEFIMLDDKDPPKLPDHKQISIGLSGVFDIGLNKIAAFGSSSNIEFNLSAHVGFTWYYHNRNASYVYPNGTNEDSKAPHSDYIKSNFSGVFVIMHPNLSFMNNIIYLGPIIGIKHISHNLIDDCKINTLALVAGMQLRFMIKKWIGITASYQYDIGLKNFVSNKKHEWMKDVSYSNHNAITIGVTLIPYVGTKLYVGFTLSPFTCNLKKISMKNINNYKNNDKKASVIGYMQNNNKEFLRESALNAVAKKKLN